MAKSCLLGNRYCKEARFLWADVQDAFDEYFLDSSKQNWAKVEKHLQRYLSHRRKCSNGRMVQATRPIS